MHSTSRLNKAKRAATADSDDRTSHTPERLSQIFAALADPIRRDIVARLAEGDGSVTELAEPYPISLQAVSKHLQVLERAGLVTRSRDRQKRPVHLEADVLALSGAWLERHRRNVEQRYQRLDALLDATSPNSLNDQEELA